MRGMRINSIMNKKFVFTLLLLLVIGNVYAQGPVDCDPLNPFFEDCEPEDVPIDSGVIFLIIAGVLLGLRALKKDSNLKEA
jgi:hypothetical protein